MSKRDTVRQEAEQKVIAALSREWRSAKQVSMQVGFSWRIVARTLKRLSLQGSIESQPGESMGLRCRKRPRPEYRSQMQVNDAGPAWFRLAAGFVVRED